MAANLPRDQRIELIRRAWALAVKGRSQTSIATELGVSQMTVSRFLETARRRTWDRLSEEARTYVILSLRQTDEVLDEAFQAFERSKRPKKSATKRTSTDGSTKAVPSTTDGSGQTTTQITEREGDPAWLTSVMTALRLRHELLDRFVPKDDRETPDNGDGTVAGAILEAERRNEAYRCTDTTTTATTSPESSDIPPTPNSLGSSS